MAEEDLTLTFPKKLFTCPFGIGIDLGSSTVKVIYTVDDGDNLVLKFMRFSNSGTDAALQFISEVCEGKLEPQCEVFVTGIVSTSYQDTLSKALNTRVTTITEGHVHPAILTLIAHQPWDAIVHSPTPGAMECGATLAKQYSEVMKAATAGIDEFVQWPCMEDEASYDKMVRDYKMEEQLIYPYALTLIGSTCFYMIIQAPDRLQLVNQFGSPGGRAFLGLTSLLTDLEDFDEMIELASRGDASKVDQLTSAVGGDDREDIYSASMKANIKINPFGHCHGKRKEDFNKEDLAAAVVSLIVINAVEQTYTWAQMYKAKQVLFSAGFSCSHPYIRAEIEKTFHQQRFANVTGHVCDCRFLKHGAYLSAFGPLWKNLGLSQQ